MWEVFYKEQHLLEFSFGEIKHENGNYFKIGMEITGVYFYDLYFHRTIK